jgi:hypothetical protein
MYLETLVYYEEILETADTIEGNSVLKANYVTKYTIVLR